MFGPSVAAAAAMGRAGSNSNTSNFSSNTKYNGYISSGGAVQFNERAWPTAAYVFGLLCHTYIPHTNTHSHTRSGRERFIFCHTYSKRLWLPLVLRSIAGASTGQGSPGFPSLVPSPCHHHRQLYRPGPGRRGTVVSSIYFPALIFLPLQLGYGSVILHDLVLGKYILKTMWIIL